MSSIRTLFSGEPYRVLFPLGIAVGMTGLLLWPAFVYGWISLYPGVMHARMMIEGFVLCFVVGFLGTALPHMLEVKPWSRAWNGAFAALISGIAVSHLTGRHMEGDLLFVATLLLMCGLLAFRFPDRRDLPPPGFPLVGAGMFCGVLGGLLLAWGRTPFAERLGGRLVYEGFILLPILGIGAFLLPRMLGVPNRQKLPCSRTASAEWKRRAREHGNCGSLLVISLVMEAAGWVRSGLLLRGLAFAAGFLLQVPLWRVRELRGTIAKWLPLPFVFIPLGYLLMAALPARRMDLLHVVMIGGVALLILLVASRVALGHGGGSDRLYVHWRGLNWVGGLTLLALATRVSAPWLRKGPMSHYAYAGVTLALVFLWWLVRFSPYLMAGGDHPPTTHHPQPT